MVMKEVLFRTPLPSPPPPSKKPPALLPLFFMQCFLELSSAADQYDSAARSLSRLQRGRPPPSAVTGSEDVVVHHRRGSGSNNELG